MKKLAVWPGGYTRRLTDGASSQEFCGTLPASPISGLAETVAPGWRVTVIDWEWFTKGAAAPSRGPDAPATGETPGLPKRIQPTWLTFWNLREQVTLPAAPGPLARQAPKWEVEQLVGAGAVGEIAGVGDGWGSGEVSTLGVEEEGGSPRRRREAAQN